MENLLEKLSRPAKEKIEEAAITEIGELSMFNVQELQQSFSFTLKDVVELKRTAKRPRDDDLQEGGHENEDSDEKNGCQGVMAGMIPDPLGTRELVPSRWAAMDAAAMRGLFAAGPWGRIDNPHLKQEVGFLSGLALLLREEGGPCTNVHVLVWSRLCQVAMKSMFPVQALEIETVWNGSLMKIKEPLCDDGLLRHVARVYTELTSKSKNTPRTQTNPYQPPQPIHRPFLHQKGKFQGNRK
jgi:hypothetical protein